MATFSKELKELLEKVNSTPDFSYVVFSDVNTTNALGENALHVAVIWNDIEAVKLLIAAGIDINKNGEYGYTPLHYASEYGHIEIVKLLLDSGANPFSRTEGDIPFTLARMSKNDAICDLLSGYMKDSPHRPKSSPSDQHLGALKQSIEKLENFIEENCKKK